MNIVCSLCGFHTMMTFMGTIGSMMKGSGLEQELETVYGPNTITHMISVKVFSMTRWGHILVEDALLNKIMLAALPQCEQNDEA